MDLSPTQCLCRMLRGCADRYQESHSTRARIDSGASLFVAVALDASFGFPTVLRLLYVFPLCFAAQGAGRTWGLGIIGASSLLLSAIDASVNHAPGGLVATFAINAVLMGVVWRVLVHLEEDLSTYQTLATHDSLTGLPNRLGLNRYAAKALKAAGERKQVLSLAVLDCNGFKELNDTLGHAYGDLVLKLLARSLRRTIGRTAFAARTGGDEFAVVFPATERTEAIMFMARASRTFAEVTRELGEGTTFAFGIAEYDGSSTLRQLLADAAARMYARKRSGRAVVEMAEDDLDPTELFQLES